MNTTQAVNRTFTHNLAIHFTSKQCATRVCWLLQIPALENKKILDNFNQFRKEVEIDVVE
jgi:hypothetical protein